MRTDSVRSRMISCAALLLALFASMDAMAAIALKNVANPNLAAAGDRVRYAVTISNSNTTTATVYLTAVVPAGTTVASSELSLAANCNGVGFTTCAAGQTLAFSGFNLPAGASVTVVYPAQVNTGVANGTKMSSTATATIGTTKLTGAASASVNSTAATHLHLTVSALPAQALPGGTVTYTLTYANPAGAVAGVAANLSFTLPAGTTFVSASGGGTDTSGVVSWTLGTLAAHSSGRQTVVLQVPKGRAAGTQLSATASLINPTTLGALAKAGLTTGVGNATVTALNIRAVATPDPVAPGQRVNYAVTVSNSAAATHTVYLRTTVPANTTVAASELSLAANCDGVGFTTCAAGQTLGFSGFNLPAGASVTVVYPALVSTTTPPANGTLLNSDVWVDDTVAGNEYQTNVAAVAQSATGASGLHLTASALPAQALASGAVTYTLTYGNPGGAGVAANLSFPLPAGTTFVSASGGGTSSGGVVSWTLGTLAAHSAGRQTVVLQVASTAAAGSQLAADAALLDPTSGAALVHAGLTTGVGNATVTALNIRAVATPDPVAPGQRVNYAVTVSNSAAATHTVYLRTTVPANTTVAASELSLAANCDGVGFTTCAAGQTLGFSGFNLPAGASVTVVYPALVSTTTPPANGTLLNSDVWVDDTVAGNEYQTNVAAVAQSATGASGLHLTASALPAQALASGAVTYTLTYGNPGGAGVAANLSFPLPAGTTFVSASGGGTSSGGVVSWTLGTLAAHSAGRQTVVLQVASTAAAGSQLAADAALLDPTSGAALVHAGLTTGVGNATVTALNIRAVATPDPVAPGQRVNYAVTVSNSAAATHTVYLRTTVPANTTVAASELSLAANCDGVGFTTCAAGQTLGFSGFNLPAGASVTVVYPALVSTTTPPANGTLLNSDVWVDDTVAGNEYQTNVAAIAQSATGVSGLHLTASALPAQVLASGAVTYTLTYGNPGTAGVKANLSFPLPSGTTFVSASGGGTNTSGVVSWTLGTVAAGSAGQQTVALQVASTAAAGSQLAADAALLNPTTGAALVHAGLTTGVGNSTVTALSVSAAATPNPAAPGQTVSYSVTVSNSAAATHTVYLKTTVPANTTVAASGLSLAANCDGVGFTTCAAGQTLAFSGVNVTAGGKLTVTYPALVSTTTPPANGTLLNSDVWVDDTVAGNEYQTNVAAVAQSGASANPPQLSAGVLAQVLNGGAVSAVQSSAAAPRRAGSAGAGSSSTAQTGAGTRQPTVIPAAGAVGATLSADTRVIVALDDTVAGGGKAAAAANSRWPTDLGQRLQSEGDASRPVTVKQSAGGLGLPPASEASRAVTELESSARTQGTAKYLIFLDGIRDEPVTADQIIARHRQIIVQSHALGLKVMGGTIPAFGGTTLLKHAALDEANRRAVNAWIRTSGAYDAVIDFDLATSDPQQPSRLLPAYDGGDHLHLNEMGYKAMADAIDLSLFDE